jgi:cytochrome c peroxidase
LSAKKLALVILVFVFFSFRTENTINAYKILGDYLETNAKLIISELDTLQSIALSDKKNLKSHFQKSRRYFKEIEFAVEFASPFYSKYYVNGPPIKKSELEYGNRVFEPHGFQLLESVIYGNDTTITAQKFIEEVILLKDVLGQIKNKFKAFPLKDEVILEMIKLETIRIISLNISGYDCAINKENVQEAYYSLSGIEKVLTVFTPFSKNTSLALNLNKTIKEAKSYLLSHKNYDNFNRLHFIVTYFKPLYKNISLLHKDLKLIYSPINYAINFREDDFFGDDIFNKHFFSVNLTDTLLIDKQAELGKFLFFDPILSGNNKRACASCHKPQFGYSDTLERNLHFNTKETLKRNTPTLLNAAFQRAFFYDGRSLQMEDQVSDVLHNITEMNSTPELMVQKLKESDEYKKLFITAFKGTVDTAITFYAVLKSIAEYEKKLVSLNSRFDKYLKGNLKAITPSEINGYNLFSGKALCGTCHFFPLFNGLVPPVFNDTDFEVIGIPLHSDNKQIDTDSGRITISKHPMHFRAFKTPTVRNIALTAPYMHNGAYKNIDQVLDFYKKGGGSGLGFSVPNQTLPFDTLVLNKTEIKNIKSFLFSLTDTSSVPDKPHRLPQFKNAELNIRKIGGEY